MVGEEAHSWLRSGIGILLRFLTTRQARSGSLRKVLKLGDQSESSVVFGNAHKIMGFQPFPGRPGDLSVPGFRRQCRAGALLLDTVAVKLTIAERSTGRDDFWLWVGVSLKSWI